MADIRRILPCILISMATFVYFNPFKHWGVTYIFSICEVLLYIGLTLHCRHIYSEAEVHIVLFQYTIPFWQSELY